MIREKDELFISIIGYRYISEYQTVDSCTKYFHINASDIFVLFRPVTKKIYYGVLDSSEGKKYNKENNKKNNKKNEIKKSKRLKTNKSNTLSYINNLSYI